MSICGNACTDANSNVVLIMHIQLNVVKVKSISFNFFVLDFIIFLEYGIVYIRIMIHYYH